MSRAARALRESWTGAARRHSGHREDGGALARAGGWTANMRELVRVCRRDGRDSLDTPAVALRAVGRPAPRANVGGHGPPGAQSATWRATIRAGLARGPRPGGTDRTVASAGYNPR